MPGVALVDHFVHLEPVSVLQNFSCRWFMTNAVSFPFVETLDALRPCNIITILLFPHYDLVAAIHDDVRAFPVKKNKSEFIFGDEVTRKYERELLGSD
jgi:hypothetical protein